MSRSAATDGAIRTRAEATHALLPSPWRKRGAPVRSHEIDDRALDIANRLRFVCDAMPPEEHPGLARPMAIIEFKHSARAMGDGSS